MSLPRIEGFIFPGKKGFESLKPTFDDGQKLGIDGCLYSFGNSAGKLSNLLNKVVLLQKYGS